MSLGKHAMIGLLRDSVAAWRADYAPSMGAALSYYMIFSIAPLLVIVIAIAGLAFGAEAFTAGKFLIGLYIGTSGVASGFGAAGSLVVLLVWVYYSAQIFLLGAEFTSIYTYRHGSLRGLERGVFHASE